jgi:voltage-gated potassium channel
MIPSGSSIPSNTPVAQRKFGMPNGVFRFSAVQLLIALALLFVTAPLIEDLPQGDLVEVVLLTLVMLSAVLAVGGRRRVLITALALLVPALTGKWVDHLHPGLVSPEFFLVATVLYFGFVVANLLRFILVAPKVDLNVLSAGVAGFLMVGLLWTPAYLAVARVNPGAFSLPASAGGTMDGFSAFYFSFMTLTTVGYGDITPVSRAARVLALTEAITGMFYIAVLISRLVSVYSAAQSTCEPASDGKP